MFFVAFRSVYLSDIGWIFFSFFAESKTELNGAFTCTDT